MTAAAAVAAPAPPRQFRRRYSTGTTAACSTSLTESSCSSSAAAAAAAAAEYRRTMVKQAISALSASNQSLDPQVMEYLKRRAKAQQKQALQEEKIKSVYLQSQSPLIKALLLEQQLQKQQQQQQCSSSSMNVVEIAPGQHLTFHGVHETKTAIQRNSFVGPISCGSCQESLFCIQGAAYCQCPLCDAKTFLFHNWNEGGGVGLGFTLDDLEQLQWTATTTTTTSSSTTTTTIRRRQDGGRYGARIQHAPQPGFAGHFGRTLGRGMGRSPAIGAMLRFGSQTDRRTKPTHQRKQF
mmetsp:Transcript_1938/g.4647  ORF Transcript_1938/g.4647 Transcript_1938/m.4647 type:complete len:295 (+) Transcript_1938:3-887(+)